MNSSRPSGSLNRFQQSWGGDGVPRGMLIIIPAFNEESGIAAVIRSIRRAAGDLPVLVINDGSVDGTVAAGRAAGAVVVSHPFNIGYGCALQTGYRYALAHSYTGVIQVDADGQHDSSSIPKVRRALEEGWDLVLGSRFLDPRSYQPSWVRRIGMTLFGLAASWAQGERITDATTGFQGLSRRLLRFYTARGGFPHDYPDANMIIRAARAGFRITEVPVWMHTAEGGGEMHGGFKPLWYVVKMSLAVSMEASRRWPRTEE